MAESVTATLQKCAFSLKQKVHHRTAASKHMRVEHTTSYEINERAENPCCSRHELVQTHICSLEHLCPQVLLPQDKRAEGERKSLFIFLTSSLLSQSLKSLVPVHLSRTASPQLRPHVFFLFLFLFLPHHPSPLPRCINPVL